MGKRYDAEKVAEFIHVLSDSVNKYGSRAELLKENYKKYISNEKYRGDLADESKKYLSLKQIQLHEGVVWIQQKILKTYTEIESDFKESVDRSEKARIDTDVLITTKKDFCIYQNAVDVHGGAIEDEAAWLEEELEGYLSFTQPSFDDPRKEYDDFCGKGKFLDKCLEKFEKFDSDACDYVNRTGLEDIIDEHRRDISKAVSDLNKVTDFRPEVEKIELTSLAVGAKAIVNATENSDAQMTQDEKVDLWLTPGYKLSEAEVAEAKALASAELSKVEFENGTHKPILNTLEEKENYQKYTDLMNKCSKFCCFATTMTKHLVGLERFASDIVEDVVGTAAEMGADVLDTAFGTEFIVHVLGLREQYSKKSEEVDTLFRNMSANAMTQNPNEAIVGNVTGMALAYYITKPIFKGAVSAMGISGQFGQFLGNQFGQNLQDLVVDTKPLYDELAADGKITSAEWALLGENVAVNFVMNLFQAEVDEAIDIAKQSKAAKNVTELKKLDSVAENGSGIPDSAKKI